jgi:DNA-directed RNA polymerase specialized sigma24 family protein
VVALRFLYDFTPKEVAEVLGLAEGTVWAHQHKRTFRNWSVR